MKIRFALSSFLLAAFGAFAQQPPAPGTSGATPAPRTSQAPLQIPDPHYVTVPMTIEVNAPADKVWARVGKFCDIGEWVPSAQGNTCKYLQGDGGVGTERSVVNEVLVGKTEQSYTYAQAPRVNTPYNLYHGTLEVVPLTVTTSRLNYVVFLDISTLPDEAAREKYLKDRETGFNQRLRNMKTLAEGGTLEVPKAAGSAAGGGGRTAAAQYLSPNPTYVVIPVQIEVNAPVDTVWEHIGHFCDVGKLGPIGYPACAITSGVDGEYGVVRNIGREVLVGKTKYSYTYAQQMQAGGFYPMYHGTVEARAVGPAKTTLFWTVVYDNSNLPDEATKAKDMATRRTHLEGMLEAVKAISEGAAAPAKGPGQTGR